MTARTGPWHVTFALLAVIWGSSFWWVDWALDAFSPIQVAVCRYGIGALCLSLWVVLNGIRFPRGRSTWLHVAITGLLVNAIPGGMVAVAQTTVSSSFAAVLSSVAPLVVLVMTIAVFREQRPSLPVLLGLLLGFVGVVVFLGFWEAAPSGHWWGIVALVVGAVSVGIGWPYFAHFLGKGPTAPLAIVSGQLLMATMFLLPLAVAESLRSPVDVHLSEWHAISAVVALGLINGAVGNSLNFSIIRSAGPAITSMVMYAVPVVAVAIGVFFLGDRFTWFEAVGGVIILIGIALTQGRFSRPMRRISSRKRDADHAR